jgi:hypothetical protein
MLDCLEHAGGWLRLPGRLKLTNPNPAQVYNTLVRDGLVRNRLADGEDGDASPARKPREAGGRSGRGRSRGARSGGGGRARGAGGRGGASEAGGDDASDGSGSSCIQRCSGAVLAAERAGAAIASARPAPTLTSSHALRLWCQLVHHFAGHRPVAQCKRRWDKPLGANAVKHVLWTLSLEASAGLEGRR